MNNVNFDKINKVKNDDFPTPKILFQQVIDFINKEKPDLIQNKLIYEPFYCDGESGGILQELIPTSTIFHQNVDFFEYNKQLKFDIILSNPPYSLLKKILSEIADKPTILLIPLASIHRVYFQKIIGDSSILFSKPIKWGNYKEVFPIQLVWIFINCKLEKQIYTY